MLWVMKVPKQDEEEYFLPDVHQSTCFTERAKNNQYISLLQQSTGYKALVSQPPPPPPSKYPVPS